MCGWSIHACLEINSQPVIASASNTSKRQRGRESERFSGDGRALHVCLPDPARKVVKTNLRFAQLGVHVLDFSHRWCTLSFHPRGWKWRRSKLYEYNKEYYCFNHFITIMKLITFGSFLITSLKDVLNRAITSYKPAILHRKAMWKRSKTVDWILYSTFAENTYDILWYNLRNDHRFDW